MPKRRTLKSLIGFLLVIGGLGRIYGLDVHRNTHPKPEVAMLFSLLQLRLGMTAAEIGAGEGRMTVEMARRLRDGGHVFSTDIGSEQVGDIKNAVSKAGLQSIGLTTRASQPRYRTGGYSAAVDRLRSEPWSELPSVAVNSDQTHA